MLPLLEVASQVADITSQTHRKAFIGAVAIRKDGTLVHARNGVTIRPDGPCPSSHAEARVLKKSGHGSTVYVARTLKNGSLAMAKPCSRCMARLKSRGVELVYWTISNNEWEACRP